MQPHMEYWSDTHTHTRKHGSTREMITSATRGHAQSTQSRQSISTPAPEEGEEKDDEEVGGGLDEEEEEEEEKEGEDEKGGVDDEEDNDEA